MSRHNPVDYHIAKKGGDAVDDLEQQLDRVDALLREMLIDFFYRIEHLEQGQAGWKPDPGSRLPRLATSEDIENAMRALRTRVESLEDGSVWHSD